MVLLSFNYSPYSPAEELHLPKIAQRRDLVCAVILAGTNSTNLLNLLDVRGIPYVAHGNRILWDSEEAANDVVSPGDRDGGRDMTRYLISMGASINLVCRRSASSLVRTMFAGQSRAMEEAGLEVRYSTTDSEDDPEIVIWRPSPF